MRCNVVQEQFSEFYDGMAENQALIEKHLHNCPACAAEYEGYKQMLDELRQIPEPELPEGFHSSIMAKINEIAPPSDHAIDELLSEIETRKRLKETRSKKQPKAAVRRWAGIVAAACLLFASIWGVRMLDLQRSDEAAPAAGYSAPDAVTMAPPEAPAGDIGIAAADEAWGHDDIETSDEDNIWLMPQYADIEPAELEAYWPLDEVSEDLSDGVATQRSGLADDIFAEEEHYGQDVVVFDSPEGFSAFGAQEELAPPPPEGLAIIEEIPRPWAIIIAAIAVPVCIAFALWHIYNKKPKRNRKG